VLAIFSEDIAQVLGPIEALRFTRVGMRPAWGWVGQDCPYSSEVQQRHPPKASQPIFDNLPDLGRCVWKPGRHEFGTKRSQG
jgi:hypothetical protein